MLLILMTSTSAFPLFEKFSLTNDSAETTTPTVIHHRHRKASSFANISLQNCFIIPIVSCRFSTTIATNIADAA
ncbi:hypothetical protein Y032_0431g1320 [Ancylostoma ceylanicum]|uniref:Uncharacterized protein n=1 Tax=Ancylostoma ceylanicum TaxID=53326 RepID=A0A016WZU1_9BILA|nr:hypothetical protein Y032_0431g1320 [Ancylostoma ceylanicum]